MRYLITTTILTLTAVPAMAANNYVTQSELNKVDQEDHRLKAGYVNGDKLVLVTEDQPAQCLATQL